MYRCNVCVYCCLLHYIKAKTELGGYHVLQISHLCIDALSIDDESRI